MKRKIGFTLAVVFVVVSVFALAGCKDPFFEIAVEVTFKIQNDCDGDVIWLDIGDKNDADTSVYDGRHEEQILAANTSRDFTVKLYKNIETENWDCTINMNVDDIDAGRWSVEQFIRNELELTGKETTVELVVDSSGILSKSTSGN